MKSTIIIALTAAVFGFSQSVSALEIKFRINAWYFAYYANGDVLLQLQDAANNPSYYASVWFYRGFSARDKVNLINGNVSLSYPISELPNIQNLLEQSPATFLNYSDEGFGERGYLYSNHQK